MEPNQPQAINSPFRQKIFSLMSQQHPSKVLKLSQKLNNKTTNLAHSPFKQYSLDTLNIQDTKIHRLDTSNGVKHFKSLQQKLGLKNLSNSKSHQKYSNQKSKSSSNNKSSNLYSKQKKVSFIEKPSKFYYNPIQNKSKQKRNGSKSKRKQSKSKRKQSKSVNKSLSKSKSSYNLRKHNNSTHKQFKNQSVNSSINKSSKNIKPYQTFTQKNNRNEFETSQQYLQSTDKQTQKKNYLLQTLKKMQSVRKNLTKTFQQFDQKKFNESKYEMGSFGSRTQRSIENISQIHHKKGSKQKSKSNLTVISDLITEENESRKEYKMNKKSKSNKKRKQDKQGSKRKMMQESMRKENRKQKVDIEQMNNNSKDIFNKKTPSKNRYLNSNQSLSEQKIITTHTKSSTKLKVQRKQKRMQSQQRNKQDQLINKESLKKIIKSCKNPQKWISLLQNQLISIYFRVVKRKLIQIQIHAQSLLHILNIQLNKSYLICQSIKQEYKNVKNKQIITLLCSVRGINLNHQQQKGQNKQYSFHNSLFNLPKLLVNIQTKMDQQIITYNQSIQLPYTFIMLLQNNFKSQKYHQSSYKKQHSSSKKQTDLLTNRVKTKSIIQNIQLNKKLHYPNLLDIINFYNKTQQNKSSKKINKHDKNTNDKSINNKSLSKCISKQLQTKNFAYNFLLQDYEFKLTLSLNYNPNVQQQNTNKQTCKSKSISAKKTYSLQIQGKGQALMAKLLLFMELLG